MPMRTYRTILAGSTGISPNPSSAAGTNVQNFLPTQPGGVILGSQAFVGTGIVNEFIGSSAIGTTNFTPNIYAGSTAVTPLGFQNIEFSNGFSVQVNVGLASSAAGFQPSGTVTLKVSDDGINYTTFPTSAQGVYTGYPVLTFSSSGSFNMVNYPNPPFNWVEALYTAGSSSAASIWSAVLTSKTNA